MTIASGSLGGATSGGGGTPTAAFPLVWAKTRWYGPPTSTHAPTAAVVGRLVFVPWLIPTAMPLKTIRITLAGPKTTWGSTPTRKVHAAFYADSGSWAPGARLFTFGAHAITSSVSGTPGYFTAGVTLPVGQGWLCFLQSGTALSSIRWTTRSVVGGNAATLAYWGLLWAPSATTSHVTSITYIGGFISKVTTFAAPPAVAPTLGTLTPQILASTGVPCMKLQPS